MSFESILIAIMPYVFPIIMVFCVVALVAGIHRLLTYP